MATQLPLATVSFALFRKVLFLATIILCIVVSAHQLKKLLGRESSASLSSVAHTLKQRLEQNLGLPVSNTVFVSKSVEVSTAKSVSKLLKERLEQKLSLPVVKKVTLPDACHKNETLANSCNGTCLQMEIPHDIGKRINQIVEHQGLHMTERDHENLRELAKTVPGQYDVILATGASSNHFKESQALLKNLHEVIFPHLKNFTLVYYNLGLNSYQRKQLVKYCRCHVIDFPFHKYPKFFKNVKCYTWKPIIIKAHIAQANVLVWLDASVNFHRGFGAFQNLVNRTKERGLQFGGPDRVDAAFRTMPSMYHFFGDEPCAFLTMGEVWATTGFFSREYFVERLFLEPWVSCAINQSCMCPSPYPPRNYLRSEAMFEKWTKKTGPAVYGLVHRFDQSALGLLVQKVYRDRFHDVLFNLDDFLQFRKTQRTNYFPRL